MTHPSLTDVCRLSEPLREDRPAWIRDELSAARCVQPTTGGMVFEFEPDPARRERLARLATLERACCDPERLRFELQPETGDGRIRLALLGLEADHPWVRTPTASPGRARP